MGEMNKLPSAGTKRIREEPLSIDYASLKRTKLCITPRQEEEEHKEDSAPSTSSPCVSASFDLDSEVADSEESRLDALDSSTFLSQGSMSDTSSLNSFSSLEEDEPEGEQEIEDDYEEESQLEPGCTPQLVVEERSLQRAVDKVEPDSLEEEERRCNKAFMEDIGRAQYNRYPIDRFTLAREHESWPRAEYLNNRAVTLEHRRELFVWMTEALAHFRCHSEARMLAFSIMHRYLSLVPELPLSRLQLAAVAVLFLALKYSEGVVLLAFPRKEDDKGGVDVVRFVEELLPQSGDSSQDDLLEMEAEILDVIDWDLNCPLPIHFLVSYWDVVDPPVGFSMKQAWFLSLYVVELMMAEACLLQFTPSTVAAAAVYVVRLLAAVCSNKQDLWTPELQDITLKNSQQLGGCVREMMILLQQEARYLYVKDDTNVSPATFTYRAPHFESVSLLMTRIILSPRAP